MRIEIDGQFYRERRGKLVLIPAEWLNQVPTSRTMRKRASNLTNKKKRDSNCNRSPSKWLNDFKDERDQLIED
jgi:hypothetical protein